MICSRCIFLLVLILSGPRVCHVIPIPRHDGCHVRTEGFQVVRKYDELRADSNSIYDTMMLKAMTVAELLEVEAAILIASAHDVTSAFHSSVSRPLKWQDPHTPTAHNSSSRRPYSSTLDYLIVLQMKTKSMQAVSESAGGLG